jgi:hypothetical protein
LALLDASFQDGTWHIAKAADLIKMNTPFFAQVIEQRLLVCGGSL